MDFREEALHYIREHAKPHGLEAEVCSIFRSWTRLLDPNKDRSVWMQQASDALYEWDI